MAVKLMRTYTAQIEALAKLQRGGEQVVKVVHVHPGGQAVVGNVRHGHHPVVEASLGGGVRDENWRSTPCTPTRRSRATRSLPLEASAPLPCQDTAREPVPVSPA